MYRSADEVAVTGRNVYVVVVQDPGTGAWSKAPAIPDELAAVLG